MNELDIIIITKKKKTTKALIVFKDGTKLTGTSNQSEDCKKISKWAGQLAIKRALHKELKKILIEKIKEYKAQKNVKKLPKGMSFRLCHELKDNKKFNEMSKLYGKVLQDIIDEDLKEKIIYEI